MRKGSITDLFLIIIIGFVMSVSFIIGYKILDEFQTGVENSMNTTVDYNETWNSSYLAAGKTALQVFDTMFLFIILGLGGATIITAFTIKTHPIFFVISIIVLIIAVILAAVFSNIFTEFVSQSAFIATAQNYFANVISVFQKFPLLILMLGIGIMIAMFVKGKGSGESY